MSNQETVKGFRDIWLDSLKEVLDRSTNDHGGVLFSGLSPVVESTSYDVCKIAEVAAWNYYVKTRAVLTDLPSDADYRITQFPCYKGRNIGSPGSVIAEGTFQVLRDRFSKENWPTRLMNLTYTYRVERKDGELWLPCREVSDLLGLPAWHEVEVVIAKKAKVPRSINNHRPIRFFTTLPEDHFRDSGQEVAA